MQTTKQAERDAKKLFRACLVDGSLDEARVRGVVQLVLAAGGGGRLGVLSRWLRLGAARSSEASRRSWKAPCRCRPTRGPQSKRRSRGCWGRDLATSFADNPALIGGVRVKVGSDVYDGSIQGHLAALESRF